MLRISFIYHIVYHALFKYINKMEFKKKYSVVQLIHFIFTLAVPSIIPQAQFVPAPMCKKYNGICNINHFLILYSIAYPSMFPSTPNVPFVMRKNLSLFVLCTFSFTF